MEDRINESRREDRHGPVKETIAEASYLGNCAVGIKGE